MSDAEKRKFKRLAVTLDLSCHKVDSAPERFHSGCTLNVCPGGIYFETATGAFEQGDLLNVELSIPPTEGLLEFGGRIAGFGKVLRTCDISDSPADADINSSKFGIALEFCQTPRLCT